MKYFFSVFHLFFSYGVCFLYFVILSPVCVSLSSDCVCLLQVLGLTALA